jgi:uncharacterized protein YodC (DUF2158 family)
VVNQFKVDDLVELKSGSPLLTVIGLSNSPVDGPGVIVQWLDGEESRTAHYPEVCLQPAVYTVQ